MQDSPNPHPLLGRRLRSPLKEVLFEADFTADSLPFLNDHRIFGVAVLPTTACIEMALAAARELFGAGRVENLEIQEALVIVDDSPRAVQLILTPQGRDEYTFQLFSAAKGSDNWKTHATGRIARQPVSGSAQHVALDTIRDIQSRCEAKISAESLYADLRANGLQVGPSLSGMREIQRCEGEALARIELPATLRHEMEIYVMHPALLDACLRAAALPTHSDLYLPLSIERIQIYGDVETVMWSHVVMHPSPRGEGLKSETFSANIQAMNDAGEVVAEITGLRLKRTTPEAMLRIVQPKAVWYDWLYQIEWHPAPVSLGSAAELPTPIEITEYASETGLAKHSGLVLYGQLRPKIDLLSAGYICYALQQIGWQPSSGEYITIEGLANTLGVVDSQRHLLGRMLGMLEEDGVLKRVDSGWQVQRLLEVIGAGTLHARWEMLMSQYPMFEAELVLTQRCGSQLAEVLLGVADPLQILSPGGESNLTEKLYTESPVAIAYNGLVQTVLAGIVTRVPPGRKLRVLEIGAGAGGTTSFALKILPPDQTEYTFTDISPLFTNKAGQKFEAYPFIRYRTLDIEHHPATQGFEPGQVDLILAANVIHATADLKQTLEHIQWLLSPGGTLLMLEMIRHERWVDLTFGMTNDWWRLVDGRDYPLITQESWISLLHEAGFSEAAAVPETGQTEQAIIAARATEKVKNWLIFADQCGIAEGLADLIRLEGGRCTLVWPGADYAEFDEGTLFINLSRPEHFRHILNTSTDAFTDVVHLWSLDLPAADDLSDNALQMEQEWGTGSALNLTQALVAQGGDAPRLWLVTRGAMPLGGESLAVEQAPIWGLGKVIALEHPELHCKRIDLDTNDDDIHAIMDLICAEDNEDQIALRGDTRYVARLVRYDAPKDRIATPLQDDAAYLVTGGLSGHGLRLARWLVEKGARNLVLMERSSPSESAQKVIREMEEAGAQVIIKQADVSRESDVAGVLLDIQRNMPPLRGVIHTADTRDDDPLIRQNWSRFEVVMKTKVQGAWHLHHLTRHMRLDFFVLFSSIASLFGERGQSNHAAADTFMDILAHHRTAQGLPALSINWDVWSEVGAAVRSGQAGAISPINPDDALRAFENLLAGSPPQIGVTLVDWAAFIQQLDSVPPFYAEVTSSVLANNG